MLYTEMATIRATIDRARHIGLGISETALRRWVKEGTLPVVHIGTRVLVSWSILLQFLGVEDSDKSDRS